jgi:hypothetical protein
MDGAGAGASPGDDGNGQTMSETMKDTPCS